MEGQAGSVGCGLAGGAPLEGCQEGTLAAQAEAVPRPNEALTNSLSASSPFRDV